MAVSSTAPETAWESGRFNARTGPHKLLFGRMYEDAAIELGAFPRGGHVFCIASAGCTAMKLSARHQVVAVDINPVQLAYVERRLAGAPVQPGSADRILAFLRALGPLAGWSRRTVRAFMDLDNPAEQILYWRRHLDTRRFRAAFNFLFSRPALRSMYSASFLDRLPPNFGAVMRGRMERCFALHSNRENPYARALLLGEIPPTREAPERGQIQLVCADAAAFLEDRPAGSFTAFSLSNILDGANPAYERQLLAAVQRAAAPGALAVLRSFREPPSPMQTNHAAEDRAMLWGIVEIRPANTL
jgi:S-adenosylmethionine:diacylglycerol 3-amino-3-carboxypropyl transferase